MLLGKRPRPPIRRTTSMSGINVDLPNIDALEASDYQNHHPNNNNNHSNSSNNHNSQQYGSYEYDQRFLAATMLSPRNVPTRRNSADYLETANFLRTCGLCQRRLAPGKDIYMYRGDTAFCSLECREKQMKHDERKEKCINAIMGSKKEDRHASPSTTNSASKSSSSSSRKTETVAAA
ncbi:FCS-Like Zinc finger 5 [Ricinus communis]|uniref:FCS-Like Zinc finger 5 n=1 Tax=Ricinus communis TaxID=3988 RepID=UPI00201AF2F3|nr:FCS-Like Zinc finger 5 [Ricinus communis]